MARDLCEARFSGNVGRDPIVKKGNKTRAEFSFAVKKGNDRDGNEVTDWFDIVAWEKNAEFCEKYVKKGDYLILSVTPHSYTFKNENDETRKVTNYILEKVTFPRGGKNNRSKPEADDGGYREESTADSTDAPLPF